MPKNVGVILTLKDRFSSKLKDVATKLDTTEKKLQKATMTVKKFSDSMGKGFQNAVVGVGAGMVASVTGMTAFAVKGGEVCDRIDDMSNKIGISRKGFQEWDYLLAQNGGNIESLQMGFKKLVGQVDGVTKGNKNAIKNFRSLGVSVVDSTGKIKNQEQIFNECVTALQKMPEGVKKAQLANDLFGRSGQELMPLLNQTTDKLAEQRAEYKRLGLEISDDVIDAGNEFGDALEKWKSISGMFTAMLGTQFIPVLMELSNYVMGQMPAIKSVTGSVIGGITNTIKFLIDHLNILIPIASACVSSIVAFKTISTAITVIQTLKNIIQAVSVAQGIWNALMLANPIGLIAMGIGALIGLIVLLVANWDKITKAVGRAIQKMKEFVGIKPKKDKKSPEVDIPEDDEPTGTKPSSHALGTPYFQGGATSINEGGRGEIVNLPSGSQIIPHDIVKNNNKNINMNIEFKVAGNLIGNRELFDQFADMLLNKVESKLQTV